MSVTTVRGNLGKEELWMFQFRPPCQQESPGGGSSCIFGRVKSHGNVSFKNNQGGEGMSTLRYPDTAG